ncbi:helix loop helix DNA-binding domain protein [Ceratobasidium sp. AG-Ba]|nr:helix loop helix DNA-binding domain protein [Ceratobasidium sp. AG-Ba]
MNPSLSRPPVSHRTSASHERYSSPLSIGLATRDTVLSLPLPYREPVAPRHIEPGHDPFGKSAWEDGEHPARTQSDSTSTSASGLDAMSLHPVSARSRHCTRTAPTSAGASSLSPISIPASLLLHDSPKSPGPLDSHDLFPHSSLVHRRGRSMHRHSMSQPPPASIRHMLSPLTSAAASGSDDEYSSGCDARLVRLGLCTSDARRRKTVESEQRRRNDLRCGFARLKDALPASHEKCSKLVLLDQATTYIGQLEARLREMQGENGACVVPQRVASQTRPGLSDVVDRL